MGIQDIIKAAYAGMDPHTGMFPQHNCKKCGKPLNADGGHPAELYAGTYTGLCYTCQNAGPFEVEVHPITGAVRMSHPPHCPSYRRDREDFWWFRDCDNPQCNHGRVMIWREDSRGGPYPQPCEKCGRRHNDHPVLADLTRRRNEYWQAAHKEQKRLSDAWVKACKKAGVPGDLNDPKAAEMAKPYLAKFEEWKTANPLPNDYNMALMPKNPS